MPKLSLELFPGLCLNSKKPPKVLFTSAKIDKVLHRDNLPQFTTSAYASYVSDSCGPLLRMAYVLYGCTSFLYVTRVGLPRLHLLLFESTPDLVSQIWYRQRNSLERIKHTRRAPRKGSIVPTHYTDPFLCPFSHKVQRLHSIYLCPWSSASSLKSSNHSTTP